VGTYPSHNAIILVLIVLVIHSILLIMAYLGNDYHIPLLGPQIDPYIIFQLVRSSLSAGSGTDAVSLPLYLEYVFFSFFS
jgi:hypothetical protein